MVIKKQKCEQCKTPYTDCRCDTWNRCCDEWGKSMDSIFKTLCNDDAKFIENLARWVLKNTKSVNVAQRLNILAITLKEKK